MPIYRYRCNKCGYEFDDMQPMDSVTERPCENPNNILHNIDSFIDEGYDIENQKCTGTAKRIPVGFSFKFNCSMPTYRKGE